MPLNKEELETLLTQAEESHSKLIDLTNKLNKKHKILIKHHRTLDDSEWQITETEIVRLCTELSSALNKINESQDFISQDEELKKIYDTRNVSGCFGLWKLYADNTLKAIDLKKQLSDPKVEDEKRIDIFRLYFQWVMAKFPNSGNYFAPTTASLLQQKMFSPFYEACNLYTQFLSALYRAAKKEAMYTVAQRYLARLSAHFQNQLSDTVRYQPENKGKIFIIKNTLVDIQQEQAKITSLGQSKKVRIQFFCDDEQFDEEVAHLARLDLKGKPNT